jgi:hypothetical protein
MREPCASDADDAEVGTLKIPDFDVRLLESAFEDSIPLILLPIPRLFFSLVNPIASP